MNGLMNKNWLSFGIIASFFLLLTTTGEAGYTHYLLWKIIGWTIIAFFASGIVALPLYCFKIMMPVALAERFSARELACAKALSLIMGVACLVFFLESLK